MSFVTALFWSVGTVLSLGSISAPVPDLSPVPKAPARLGSAGGRSWLLPASRCLWWQGLRSCLGTPSRVRWMLAQGLQLLVKQSELAWRR